MAITQKPSLLFTPGRACTGPLAIVLHGYSSGIEVLDLDMERCPRPRPVQSPGCHTSFHYGVDGCIIHQYVLNADTAWGFGVTVPTCPPSVCPPDECDSCTGLTVGQYNPVLSTGLPPVLPALVAGPDGTANCGVKHVAITGQSGFSALDPFGQCCNFFGGDPLDPNYNPTKSKVYNCLVKSLCEIFKSAGLIPSTSTLLVHCGELLCLDTAHLAADILACINAPAPVLPPCNCAPAVTDTPTVDLTLTGNSISAAVKIDPVIGNTLVAGPNGLSVLDPDVAVTITAVDTPCIDVTVGGASPAFTISAAPIISPTAGNFLQCTANGLFVGDVDVTTTIVAVDTPCLNLDVVQAPPGTFTITGNPILDPQAFNQIVCNPNGLYSFTQFQGGNSCGISTAALFDGIGTWSIIAQLAFSIDPTNVATCGGDTPATPTIYVPSACKQIGLFPTGATGVGGVDSYVGTDCQKHLLPVGGQSLVDCDGGTLAIGASVISKQDITSAVPFASGNPEVLVRNATGCISTIGDPGGCSAAGVLPYVLGWNGGGGFNWGRSARPALNIVTGTTNPNPFVDVILANGNVTLTPPAPGVCNQNDLWVKNITGAPITVVSSGGQLIDGVATITLDGTGAASYPFQNNGGETAHLVYDGTQWYVL